MRRFTIYDFNRSFPDDDACLDFIRDLLYPDGITCRSCGRVTKHHRLTNRKAFSCQECGSHIYPLAGTIFAKSSTRLKSWFYAMYLMASTRCGISAKQLERELGVTYKTAWRMFKQIRTLMGEQLEPFSGEVEIDETYIGGKPRLGQIRSRTEAGKWIERKTSVMGILERGGKVAALIVPDSRKKTMHPIIRERVLPESMIYTDEFKTYRGLGKQGFTHKRVNHSEKVYVAGDAHVNSIEGFFSLLKRGIGGVYHSVSSKHLQDYVNEYAFRYNHRADDEAMYDALAGRVRKVRYGRYGTYQPMDSYPVGHHAGQ
jgi:transposase